MAEKSKKKEDELKKVVAKTDQLTVDSQSKVVNSDLKNLNIENLIHVIRGQKVMLDFDLAMLYGTETRALNQAVKRNVERFPDDFMFQLTKGELESLRSQIVTTNVSRNQNVEEWRSQFVTSNFAKMGLRRPPYAFTRNGIGMLSSVLRSATAVGVNIRIMRAFTAIPEIVNNNVLMMQRILNIEQHQTEMDEKVNQIITTIEERIPKQLPEQVFATDCVWDAWTYVSDLVRSARQRIVLIDNFVDDRVLSLLDKRADNVEAMIYSRYYESFQVDLKKHNEQNSEIRFVQLSQKNHDRFLMIDDDVYLLGASVKDMGVGMCAVTKMEVSPETILGLLK
ncbi:MAG: ORF6N domain-containing protein [Bacteroidaceae bacterium]|nr:ORF6N domain-containing protein [Bacteroidaceae bacterium]